MINQLFALVIVYLFPLNDLNSEVIVSSSHNNSAVKELVFRLCDEFNIRKATIEIEYLPPTSEIMGSATKISDSYFVIQLNRKLEGFLLGIYVIHEMIHVEQYFSGRLKCDCEYYYFISKEGKECKYRKDSDYWQLNHENEAYRCWKLYRSYIRDINL